MTAVIIQFVDLLLVSLLVGTMVGIWLGLPPGDLSPGAYVEQQHLIRALNTPMPLLGVGCILLTIVLAALHRGKRLACALLVATVVCLVVAGVITRCVNQPINSQVMTWNSLAPPAHWTELRDRWWQWHMVRTLAGIGALSLLILAMMITRNAAK